MIQVIGKTGMLGMEVMRAAAEKNIPVDEMFVDITAVVPNDIRAEIVINCSGVAPNNCGRDKLVSVNQTGPHRLADACDEAGARLVHVSTDAVFNRPGPHLEYHHCDPSSTYGRTKMIGEVRRSPHLTVRTSFVGFGRRGIVAQLISTDDVIPASTQFLWNGFTATSVARLLIELAFRDDITGVIHIPGEYQNRYDLVMRVINALGLEKSRVRRDDSYITDRRLASNRWDIAKLPSLPSFDEQLYELTQDYAYLCSRTSRSQTPSSDMADGVGSESG